MSANSNRGGGRTAMQVLRRSSKMLVLALFVYDPGAAGGGSGPKHTQTP